MSIEGPPDAFSQTGAKAAFCSAGASFRKDFTQSGSFLVTPFFHARLGSMEDFDSAVAHFRA